MSKQSRRSGSASTPSSSAKTATPLGVTISARVRDGQLLITDPAGNEVPVPQHATSQRSLRRRLAAMLQPFIEDLERAAQGL